MERCCSCEIKNSLPLWKTRSLPGAGNLPESTLQCRAEAQQAGAQQLVLGAELWSFREKNQFISLLVLKRKFGCVFLVCYPPPRDDVTAWAGPELL